MESMFIMFEYQSYSTTLISHFHAKVTKDIRHRRIGGSFVNIDKYVIELLSRGITLQEIGREATTGLAVSQQKEWGGILTGFETRNRYDPSEPHFNRSIGK